MIGHHLVLPGILKQPAKEPPAVLRHCSGNDEPQNPERPLKADAADILVSTVRLLPFPSDADAVGLVTRSRFSV
jgi:hypothetical protein